MSVMEYEHMALIHTLAEGKKESTVGEEFEMCTLILLLIVIKLYKY